MDPDQQLDELVVRLKPHAELHAARQKGIRIMGWRSAIAAAVILFGTLFTEILAELVGYELSWVSVTTVVGVLAFGFILVPKLQTQVQRPREVQDRIRDEYLQRVMPELLKIASPGFSYDLKRAINSHRVTASEIFVSGSSFYRAPKASQQIAGAFGSTPCVLSLLRMNSVEQSGKYRSHKRGTIVINLDEHIGAVFDGVFGILSARTPVTTPVVILTREHVKSDQFLSYSTFGERPFLALDPCEFNDRFVVACRDPVQARAVVRPELMAALLEIVGAYQVRLGISISSGDVYVAMDFDTRLFQPPLFDRQSLGAYFEQVSAILWVMRRMNDALFAAQANQSSG